MPLDYDLFGSLAFFAVLRTLLSAAEEKNMFSKPTSRSTWSISWMRSSCAGAWGKRCPLWLLSLGIFQTFPVFFLLLHSKQSWIIGEVWGAEEFQGQLLMKSKEIVNSSFTALMAWAQHRMSYGAAIPKPFGAWCIGLLCFSFCMRSSLWIDS